MNLCYHMTSKITTIYLEMNRVMNRKLFENKLQFIKNLFNGAVIGVANIIPGVSGGTLALVLGIYERLISAIQNISPATIKAIAGILRFNKEAYKRLKNELNRIDASFLITIIIGAIVTVVALANLITYLLTTWHDPTYGFFFGLVALSAIAPYRKIKKITISTLLAGIIAAGAVLGISYAVTGDALLRRAQARHEMMTEKNISSSEKGFQLNNTYYQYITHFIYIFFLGAIAISAMILPGVSGSFLLLLLGGYFEILRAISGRDFIILSIFGLGCVTGILVFSRLLNFLLKRWHDQTMGSLFGLVIGSLWMIWPFKNTANVGNETIYLTNRLPETLGKIEIYSILAALAGTGIVALLLLMESKRKDTA